MRALLNFFATATSTQLNWGARMNLSLGLAICLNSETLESVAYFLQDP